MHYFLGLSFLFLSLGLSLDNAFGDEVDDLVENEPAYSDTLEKDLSKFEKLTPAITPTSRLSLTKKATPLTKVELQKKKKLKKLKPWKAALQKGSLLTDIKNNKELRLPEKLVVWATVDHDKPKIATIYNQELKAKYTTASTNLTSLERAYQIYPDDPPVNPKIKQALARSTDKNLRYDSSVSYRYEYYSNHYFDSLYNTPASSSDSHNIDATTFYSFGDLIDVGLAGSFQVGNWTDQENYSSSWYALYIGPSFRKNFLTRGIGNHFDIRGTLLKSLISRANGSYGRQSFSTLGYELGLNYHFKLKNGELMCGLSYRYLNSTLTSTTEDYSSNQTSADMSSLGIGFGYQWSWDYL